MYPTIMNFTLNMVLIASTLFVLSSLLGMTANSDMVIRYAFLSQIRINETYNFVFVTAEPEYALP